MSISRLAVAAAALTLLSAVAAPASVLGVWKGKLTIVKSKIPPNASPQVVQQQADLFAKITLVLTLKKDGTCTFAVKGMPMAKQPPAQTGKWSIKGDQLTIMPGQGQSQTFIVAKNGKSFGASQYGGKVMATFTR